MALVGAGVVHLLAFAALLPRPAAVAVRGPAGALQVRVLAAPAAAPHPAAAGPLSAAALLTGEPATPAAAASEAGGPAADVGAAPLAGAARPRPDHAAVARAGYWHRDDLDRPALPYSEPDWASLDGHLASGRPLRLRLYIGAQGRVDDVILLDTAAEDEAAARTDEAEADAHWIDQLRRVLQATRYVPGRRAGVDVASFTDLRIELELALPPD